MSRVVRCTVVALLGWIMLAGDALAQNAQQLPAPGRTQPEAVQGWRVSPRRYGPRARRRAPQPLPKDQGPPADSELAKAILNPTKAAPQPADKPQAPQPGLSQLLMEPASRTPAVPAPYANKIDINRCSLEQLQRLPGVGAAMGMHIMAGRPFKELGDLARDGVPLDTIQKISPLITFGANIP